MRTHGHSRVHHTGENLPWRAKTATVRHPPAVAHSTGGWNPWRATYGPSRGNCTREAPLACAPRLVNAKTVVQLHRGVGSLGVRPTAPRVATAQENSLGVRRDMLTHNRRATTQGGVNPLACDLRFLAWQPRRGATPLACSSRFVVVQYILGRRVG